jgi:hypothetical protein
MQGQVATGATAIIDIKYTANETVAIVAFRSGVISAYDIRGGFNWLGDIEKETRSPSAMHHKNDVELRTIIIEKDAIGMNTQDAFSSSLANNSRRWVMDRVCQPTQF